MFPTARDEMIAIGGRFHLAPLPGVHLLSLPPLSTIVAASSHHCAVVGGGGRVSIGSNRQIRWNDAVVRFWNSKSNFYHAKGSFGEVSAAFQSEELDFSRDKGQFQETRTDPDWRGKQGQGYRRSMDWGRSGKASESSENGFRQENRILQRHGGNANGRNSDQRINFWHDSQKGVRPEQRVFERGRRQGENERGREQGGNARWGRSEKGSSSWHGYENGARTGERTPEKGRRPAEGKGSRSGMGLEEKTSGNGRRFAREGDWGRSERGNRSWHDSENGVRPEERISERGWHGRSTDRGKSEKGSRSWRDSRNRVMLEARSRSAHQNFETRRISRETSSSEDDFKMTYQESRRSDSRQNGQGRTFGGRFRREMQEARTFSPMQRLAGRVETDALNEDMAYGGNRRPAQGSVRYSHEQNKFYGSREARGLTDSRMRYERRQVTERKDAFNHVRGITRGEKTGTRFGRAENSVRIGSSQSGRKEFGSRFNGRDADINRGKFKRRGETRLLPLDDSNDSVKRTNHIGRRFPLRPFEHIVGGQSNVIKRGRQDSENDEIRGEEPARRKLDVLIKELLGQPFQHVNKTLMNKAKWIENEEVKNIAENLLSSEQVLHVFHVLKWAEKQYWFEADSELISKVCNACSNKGFVLNAHHLFDMVKRNSLVPEASTYVALIDAYLKEGGEQSVKSAWELYHEMKESGGHEPSSDIRFSLFCAFTEKPQDSLKWLDKADDLFKTIKSTGIAISTEMYTSLIHLHALNCNTERVIDLLQDMKVSGLSVSSEIFRIILSMWAKTGDYEKVAKFYEENIDVDEPDWHNYILLIEVYLKGGLKPRALQVLDEMVISVGTLKKEMYEAIIHVMANAGEEELAENWLKELEEANCRASQSAYNALMDMYFRQHLFDKAEKVFERMETKGCRPDEDSYNILIMLNLASGQLEKAEETYERMLRKETLNPNQKTYNLMLEAFGKAGQSSKVLRVHELLTSQNYAVPFELRQYLGAAGRLDKTNTSSNQGSRLRLEKSQREILAGVLLGGARIESSNAGLSNEIHFELSSVSPVGKTLFYHLHKEFVHWANGPPVLKPIEGMDGGHQLLRFSTLNHPTFRFFSRQYRLKGNPTIPRMIHRWLSSRTLAYWYMYGGYKCSETGGIVLNASNYSVEELLPVVRCLKATIVKRDLGNIIRFHGNSEVSFWTIVKPFILPELVDFFQPSDDRLNSTDSNSWEELEGAIVDECRSDASTGEPEDARDELALNTNHNHLGPVIHASPEVEAQLSTKASGKDQKMEVVATPSVWERLADIVQT